MKKLIIAVLCVFTTQVLSLTNLEIDNNRSVRSEERRCRERV